MKRMTAVALALAALAGPALAQDAGDAAKGEKAFGKCRACHQIQAPDGTVIFKGGVTGPNLYGVIGRPIASVEGFRYGDGILKLAESHPGAVWDVHSLAKYVADPTAYLDEYSGDPKVKSKMTFKLTRDQADVAAYLLSQSPDAGAQPAETDGAPRP